MDSQGGFCFGPQKGWGLKALKTSPGYSFWLPCLVPSRSEALPLSVVKEEKKKNPTRKCSPQHQHDRKPGYRLAGTAQGRAAASGTLARLPAGLHGRSQATLPLEKPGVTTEG